MKAVIKFIIILSIIPLLIGIFFFSNIKGYYRFKQYCEAEGGLRVYEKLERNVGWLAKDKGLAINAAMLSGLNASDIEKGDWMSYANATLTVPTQGAYKVTYRVASLNGGGKISLREASNDSVLGAIAVPKTGAWQGWVDITQEITLSSGSHSFKLYAEAGGFNINWFKVEPTGAVLIPDTTPPAQPTAIIDSTGKIVSGNAEAGSSVEIKNAANTSLLKVVADSTGKYTATLPTALLNFETLNITATDAAKNISDVKTINAPDKTKPISPTAAIDNTGKIVSGVAEAGSTVEVKNSTNTTSLGKVTAHATTGAYSITLPVALINNETVNVTATDAAGNVSYARAASSPVSSTPLPSALIIQAEDFSSMLGVSTQTTSDVGGGRNAGDIEKGDWMSYANATLTVPTQGAYKVTYRVASLNGGGKISLREASNDSVLGAITVPKTGAWQGWVDITQEITLSSGSHSFKLYVAAGGFNINWFKVEPVPLAVSNSMMKRSESSISSWNQFDGMIQAMAGFSPASASESKVLVSVYNASQPILASQS